MNTAAPHFGQREGEFVYVLCYCWPQSTPLAGLRHISPLTGMSSQAVRSFADTVLTGSRYFILLSCDTAAPLTAISALQLFDSSLDRKHFS